MKCTFTRLIKLFIFVLIPGLVIAQPGRDYSVLLNTGKITPIENISQLNNNAEVFKNSRFESRYYVVIQFNKLPDQAEKEKLKSAGIELIDYLPYYAYTASISTSTDINQIKSFTFRSIFSLNADQKAMPVVLAGNALPHAIKQQGFVDVTILTYELLNRLQIVGAISQYGGIIIDEAPMFKNFIVRIPKENVRQLANLPFVQWVEFIDPPNQPENLPGRTLHKANVLQDGVRNLKGDGMNIGVFDERASQHLDFSPSGRMINVDAGTAGSHGTHVSGTVGGKGIINPIAKGMAPNATIYSYYGFSGDVQVRMATEIPAKTLISSNHSYHDGLGVQ
ncbi:MAG: S8 family serine peptidase, partial [Chitinophagaceae bacterium]